MGFDRRLSKACRDLRRLARPRPPAHLRTRILYPVGAVSVVGVGIAVGLSLLSSPVRAFGWADLTATYGKVPAAYIRTLDSRGQISREEWHKGKKRRYQDQMRMSAGFDGEHWWQIDPWLGIARKSLSSPFLEGNDEPSIDRILAEQRERSKSFHVSQEPTEFEGRKLIAFEVVSTPKWAYGEPFRMRILADPTTRLPVRIEGFRKRTAKDANWARYSVKQYFYPKELPDAHFAFQPKGLVVYDEAAMAASMRAAAKAPGQTVGGVEVRLLGAFQEESGEVHILWTGGATPNVDMEAAALDEKGVGYGVALEVEEDDRNRPRNQGAAPKPKTPKLSRLGFDRPYRLRPYCWLDGVPVYSLRATTEYRWPNVSRELKVRIPVCAPGPDRVFEDKYGFQRISNGVFVGLAEFDIATTPCGFFPFFVRQFDPKKMPSIAHHPLRSMHFDAERHKLLERTGTDRWMARQSEVNAKRWTGVK